jgi:hypothetical protein
LRLIFRVEGGRLEAFSRLRLTLQVAAPTCSRFRCGPRSRNCSSLHTPSSPSRYVALLRVAAC